MIQFVFRLKKIWFLILNSIEVCVLSVINHVAMFVVISEDKARYARIHKYILCESFDFSRFVDNFPDFPPISLPYFPILRKLNNFTLWNFHMVCKRPCRQRLLSAQASRCLEFSFSRDRVLLRCWAFLALKYEEPLINVFLASYFCIRGA